MDVVWLKKDIRLHDHAPLTTVLTSARPFLIIYVYEPDQLAHKTVHGSHLLFQNEALRDFESTLSNQYALPNPVTYFHANITQALDQIYGRFPFNRLLAHQETGHLASFHRDNRVRIWCKEHDVTFTEFQQLGVKRPLHNRDNFSKYYNAFISHPQYTLPTPTQLPSLSHRLVTGIPSCGILPPSQLPSLDPTHAQDRIHRAKGGETAALAIFESFLNRRAEGYSRGVSSPNSAWSSCSRLSPYLAFGHISIRRIVQALTERQRILRQQRKQSNAPKDYWLKSLAAFHSRLRWRSHFIQKLESHPDMELYAQCKPLNSIRCAPGDWNESHYKAWAAGTTGFPMVDACMRCLLEHGWLNFRMRAMLVSFACYNLWLDWRGIADHLARCFLDFEPGIHYPQLQMQAGVTGINAMRVYNPIKQSHDQDPDGKFIKRYVPELRGVSKKFVHEPWKMDAKAQRLASVQIDNMPSSLEDGVAVYPSPIVDVKSSVSSAKSRMQSLRQSKETKDAALKVYEKLGSRMGPTTRRGQKRHPVEGVMDETRKLQGLGKKQKLISSYFPQKE